MPGASNCQEVGGTRVAIIMKYIQQYLQLLCAVPENAS